MKRFVHLFSCVLVSCFTRVLHKSDFLEQESWINMKNVAEWREHSHIVREESFQKLSTGMVLNTYLF